MLHRSRYALLTSLALVSLAACGGGSGFDDEGAEQDASGPASLSVMIGSSGPAETDAVTKAVQQWAEDSGNQAEVIAATDLNQQLSQGFAAGSPPDVFYVSSDSFAGYAENGSLLPYAADLENAGDFYPSLKDAFTYDDEFYCAPKDFSTLGLVINNDAWKKAGLTDADVPKDWDQLRSVAKKLTTNQQAGLVTSTEYQRLGAFMSQAGGGLVENGKATADSAANVEALNYVQSLLDDGSMKTIGQVGAGWGGEAFGSEKAAMTIEGNWITGALAADFPEVDYQVQPLPEGSDGPGTLSFTNCWGVAADSPNQAAATDLVSFLTSSEQQMQAARAFGVMPSVQSAAGDFSKEFPELQPFLDQVESADTVPNAVGVNEVIADLNAQLESIAEGDPKQILSGAQDNLEAVLEQQ